MIVFIAAVLATWRASLLVTDEEGPFGAFQWIRDHLDPYQKTWLGRGLSCTWCVSWWAGLVAAGWLWAFGYLDAALIPIWWFGLSGGAILVHNTLTRRR